MTVGQHTSRSIVIGGGVAGLTAGWRLAEAGFEDFTLFEMEDSTGGNARSGRNGVSAYPLGAHYLPVPNREAVEQWAEEQGLSWTSWAGNPALQAAQHEQREDRAERLLPVGAGQHGQHGRAEVEGLRRREQFYREHGRDVFQDVPQLPRPVRPHGDVVFLVG